MADLTQTVSISTEARARFLRYAMSVVTGRALPDVRDGLKPVQRRILYAMYQDLNLTSDRKPLKGAKIVGGVMETSPPHGTPPLYVALARPSKWGVRGVPWFPGRGNSVPVEGPPPAGDGYP